MLQNNYFFILAFLGLFLAKKQPKSSKKEENWQNPNCFIKFSEIWFVNASHQKKIQQKIYFSILAFFGKKKLDKIDQKWRKLAKSKPFDNIFWNLICRCFPTKENATKNCFSISVFFGLFVGQKAAKIDLKKMKKNRQI